MNLSRDTSDYGVGPTYERRDAFQSINIFAFDCPARANNLVVMANMVRGFSIYWSFDMGWRLWRVYYTSAEPGE